MIIMTQGAFAAILKESQVLLVKPPDWVSQYSGHWNFPGGVVQIDEKLENGAEREVFEETGIKCSVVKLINTTYNEKFDTAVNIFKADYVSGAIKIQESEISDAKWFEVEEALKLPLAFDIEKTLQKLLI